MSIGYRVYWENQRKRRVNAPIGTLVDFGPCNFGRDTLILPILRRTRMRLVCGDEKHTEQVMLESGRRVGHRRGSVPIVADPLGNFPRLPR